ncbi:MAG: prephenate dehydratase [Enterococcus sp.]
MKIGYLGPESSFTHQATKKVFQQALVTYASIPACIKAVVTDEIDCAIVPVENSLEGSVHATIDTLSHSAKLQVRQEIVLPIKQQLLGTNATITRILSHPQALAQSQNFLATAYPEAVLVPMASTTAAAEYVQTHPQEPIAAIASQEAAIRYQLPILAADIQDNAVNQTRFWVITKKDYPMESLPPATKMTLVLTMPSNQPGTLHKMLATFGWREINLSKIESRPLKTNLGEYFFVIDLLLDQPSELIANALTEIQLLGGAVTVLGKYSVTIFQ